VIKGFIQNYELVKETDKTEDLLDFSTMIELFAKRLNTAKSPALIGLVGKFGIGKSTMLHQIRQQREQREIWIEFDAWKYPDRNGLWEGFVLDFADQIGKKGKVLRKIEGKSSVAPVVDVITDIADMLGSIPGFSVIDKLFKQVFKSSPAKRVFQIQQILAKLINSQDRDICIIIEDIDRSGDAGIYFLETLRQFLRSNEFEKKIIGIVPISDSKYSENFDSYLKCLDYFEFFKPPRAKLEHFIDRVIDESLFQGKKYLPNNHTPIWTGEHRKTQIASFFEYLMHTQPDITIRVIKNILRKADLNFINQSEDGHEPDFRLSILFETAKYVKTSKSYSHFDAFRKTHNIAKDTVFGAFLWAILKDQPTILEYEESVQNYSLQPSNLDFSLVKRLPGVKIENFPSWPWTTDEPRENTSRLRVCDFYLDY